ncbi:MAG TPA: hypothetical protein VGN00_15825 [Puia sp.]|jgi:hypothetical protein
MGKKVLAIYYSQSGQLRDIIDNLCRPLEEAGCTIERLQVRLQNDFPFPWTSKGFFNVMPDCVLGTTAELASFTLKETRYDLVILGYQAWFLSPSIPFNSLMHHPEIKAILKDTPVITITGARNMWVNAFGKVKKLVSDTGARHVGTIAMMDRHLNLVSIFTIFHWMLGGKKDRYLGFFPRPGVSDADISGASALGTTVLSHLDSGEWEGLKTALIRQHAVNWKYHLAFMETKAAIMFGLWARFISTRKKRQVWLVVFKYYLLLALFVFAPIVFVIDLLFFKPFLSNHVKAKKESCLRLN